MRLVWSFLTSVVLWSLDVTQILEEMTQYSRFPQTQVLCSGELGTFLIVAKRIGDRLSHGLAVGGALNGVSSCEVHGEFGVEDKS